MRYFLAPITLTVLLVLGFQLAPVGAMSRSVSGEAHITASVNPKSNIKIKLTSAAKPKLLEMKQKLTTDIASLKETIAKYESAIYDIKAKIDARQKAGITDNGDLKAKMNALMKAKNQAKKDLALLLEKLAYIESKLK